jgi:hypothetical protein
MLGLEMQRNQQIADFMQGLIKQHQSDIADMRKTQWNLAYKAWTDPNIEEEVDKEGNIVQTAQERRESLANSILSWNPTRFGMIQSATSGEGFGGTDVWGGGGKKKEDDLMAGLKPPSTKSVKQPETEIGMYERNSGMLGGSPRTPTQTPTPQREIDQYGFYIGERRVASTGKYQGQPFIYQGNNQWLPE